MAQLKIQPDDLKIVLEKMAVHIDQEKKFSHFVLLSLGNNRLVGYKKLAHRYDGKILASGSVLPWYLWPVKLIAASRTAAIHFKSAGNLVQAACELSPWGMVHICFFENESVSQYFTQHLRSQRVRFDLKKALANCPKSLAIDFSSEGVVEEDEIVDVHHGADCPSSVLEVLGM